MEDQNEAVGGVVAGDTLTPTPEATPEVAATPEGEVAA